MVSGSPTPCRLDTLSPGSGDSGRPAPQRGGLVAVLALWMDRDRRGTGKRTVLMDTSTHVDTAFADCCPNLLSRPPSLSPADLSTGAKGLPLVPRSLSRAGQPQAQRLLDVPPAPVAPWSKHRRPRCRSSLQAGGWGRPCLGAVEGGVRGGREKEAESVGREEVE